MKEQAGENFKIFEHHFEAVKDSRNQMTTKEEEKLFQSIIIAETNLEMKIFGPICHKVYHIMTSNLAYEKIFHYNFERAHHSVFSINYSDVFDHAEREADASIIQEVCKKVAETTKSEFNIVYEELKSDDSDASDETSERIAKKLRKKVMTSLKATPDYEKVFRASIHFTFENTLLSAMSSSYKKIFDSMLNLELQTVLDTVKDSL